METYFENLPKGTKFYLGEDANGGLKIFRPFSIEFEDQLDGVSISNSAAMALALTELCCESGFGKVYQFSQFDPEDSRMRDQIDAYSAFSRIADLIWVPYAWSDKDKQQWRDIPPASQLDLLAARVSDLDDDDLVLPIALEFSAIDYPAIRLLALSTALVTICVSPQPYIGYTDDMRNASPTGMVTNINPGGEKTFPYVKIPKANASKFAVRDGQEMVEKLKDIYFNGREDAKSTFIEELTALIEAGRVAAEAGQAYGLSAPESEGDDNDDEE